MNTDFDEQKLKERITQLASQFPLLKRLGVSGEWNPIKLDNIGLEVSHGERLAIQFVLSVWNRHEKWSCGQFDVAQAYAIWDETHWNAFRAWVEDPFYL